MHFSTVLVSLAILLAGEVLCAKIAYVGRYLENQQLLKHIRSDTIPDNKVQIVLKGVKRWSQDDFNAKQADNGIITVYNVQYADSKGEAVSMVREIQSKVKRHIKD
ncbi:hypothetical protein K461DRAFT_292462 [Myriangium duriaei CBS 260.36]|uniref:Uncharacterized protein n=1 Tax=Myriangium duriaei CBS 260.36 TaxID=1168546 RepID=A0A9P4MI25_9PEZI|nr:hypothetical protein K461DRAFT_292462 [Myriangium duriaei CBS 260.36]